MKKTLFTIGSVLVVITILFMACQKSTTTAVSTTSTTSGSTTGVAGNMTVDGTAHTMLTNNNVIGSAFVLGSNTNPGQYPALNINFTGTSAPAAGSYTATPTGSCTAVLTPSTSITWTVVTCTMSVTSGTGRAVNFANATFTDGVNTHTVTANLPF